MNIEYKIIRSNRKTLALNIDRQGNLTVRSPLYISNDKINFFVEQNKDWIIKNIQKRKANSEMFPKIQGINNEEIPYLGHTIAVKLTDIANTMLKDRILYIPQSKDTIEEIKKWYKRRAKEILPKLTTEYAHVLGYSFNGVKITSAKTRFGSCSGKNNINYSYKLMMYDAECIKYVIVHELCHTVHKNHSAKFWNAVAKAVPNYKNIQKQMQAQSALMDII